MTKNTGDSAANFGLDQGKVGDSFVLSGYQGDSVLQERLVELGFVRGEKLRISRKTFFGDFIVFVKGTEIALRKTEANCLLVTRAS